MLVYKQILRRY
ncbi:hypothetical protein DSL72_006235 [Monilinia vaccinii-corymbosi]|uniref:Uncharacterized protein n=1 Tax=Monilinia vaccinii-corymbosi TaxID=61207 RepID=A0A8A3PN58_9HELO|nr:hypothetical protein DSL72_006235 [Monilinia vaccinii-corymbosi]